ncbi:MAG: cell division protein FtsZ [Candidatus Nitrohelix vancouverensis]|uniref:Cell division protein FtsZ n=1 Tax=Candidatus Nitrohelix vancouverensis TaxID=2705534 RepID=A0A7T0C4R1_9BACT|nr:MAG: cell division protein FtsZ [Candidatus Nitrohelix vancouverensis]
MALIEFEHENNYSACIKVVGIGGGGTNAVNSMVRDNIRGVEFLVANTDVQSLEASDCPGKIQVGLELTRGLGAGSNPEVGQRAALESEDQIREALEGADMVFITAGMGGGTGTGGAPIISRIAKETGALTVGVVTKPFSFEGKRRILQAEAGIRELQEAVDTLIVIPNQKLLSFVGKQTSLTGAFGIVDDVLKQAVCSISDLIVIPGLINLDFADVRAIMCDMGKALMGSGTAAGENRAVEAAQKAISSPLLDEATVEGARGILINVTGGEDMTLLEVNEASTLIQKSAHEDAHIIFGSVIDNTLDGQMRVTVIATGFEQNKKSESTVEPAKEEPQSIEKASEAKVDRSIPYKHLKSLVNAMKEENPEEFPPMAVNFDIPTFLRKHAD